MTSRGYHGDEHASSKPKMIEVDEAYWAALLREGEMQVSEAAAPPPEGWLDDLDDSYHSDPAGEEASPDFPRSADWAEMREVMDSDTTLELPVIGSNRGGLLVQWKSLRGFVPASQLVDFPPIHDDRVRRDELSHLIGKDLLLRVIELDEAQNRLIFSQRAAQVEPGTRAAILDTLSEHDICEGLVTNVCDFGVFVDLGGVEGLIHISELSWGRVGHPGDVLSRGDTVSVYVMDVSKDLGRVALSLKRLQPDPWETVEERYHVGQIIEGVITNVVDFGAFACVEEGLEGLVHISELAEGQFLHPRNVVHEGETVRARILNIDGPSRRLGLSLRDLNNHRQD
ncbi:MAG: S1 RNA-binding domain-containing protein [Anaerolineae bacterium]|nr:S1 RNA-binding domain-containing protein [Anaerolineae bacterium]